MEGLEALQDRSTAQREALAVSALSCLRGQIHAIQQWEPAM